MALINHEQVTSLKEILDQDTLKELIVIYTADAQELLIKISQQLGGEDYVGIKATAHSLKGSSANLGAESMQILSKKLEDFALEKNLSAMNECYKSMQTTLPETIAELGQAYNLSLDS
jgi:HPt (histidine-containing phosphotransfer) domain-containing protein